MFKEKLIEEIERLPGVVLLKEDNIKSIRLIGGAIVAAMDNINSEIKLEPKDYDLIGFNPNIEDMVSKGYIFEYESDNTKTFRKNDRIFQFIKSGIGTIDYTVSQVEYSFHYKRVGGDLYSLENRILIPCPTSDYHQKFNQLGRLTHYQNKGFTIHDSTFNSLIDSTYKLVGGNKLKRGS